MLRPRCLVYVGVQVVMRAFSILLSYTNFRVLCDECPYWFKSRTTLSSSSVVHWPFMRFGERTFYHLVWHCISERSGKNRVMYDTWFSEWLITRLVITHLIKCMQISLFTPLNLNFSPPPPINRLFLLPFIPLLLNLLMLLTCISNWWTSKRNAIIQVWKWIGHHITINIKMQLFWSLDEYKL